MVAPGQVKLYFQCKAYQKRSTFKLHSTTIGARFVDILIIPTHIILYLFITGTLLLLKHTSYQTCLNKAWIVIA